MAILIDETKRVLVQGMTGREGQARTRLMREYGTNVVAGVTPGKGGQTILGVPVFNTPQEAVGALGNIDISVLFVPAAGVKEAAISAIEAGIKLTVLVPDRVPVWDAMEIAAAAKANSAMFVGPNTLGILSPGKGVIGMIGGRAESARQWFKPGIPTGVGVISRSGGMASSTGYYLGQSGVRLSTIAHIGGDAVLGIRIPDAALMFEADPFTEAIVIFGEIGSSQEEELAQLIRDRKVTKPVIAYIGGKAAREGTRFSHAGAIIEGGRGTHAGKVKALREAGATVVDAFGELPDAVVDILKRINGKSLMSEADKNAVWNTAVTRIEPNRVAVRGYDIADLMGRASFGAAVHLILTGELPAPPVARLMDAVLVASIDHGATPPSALAARTVASTGASLSASVAAGIMSINRHHGGAIEDCARHLKKLADLAASESLSMDEAATRTLAAMKDAGERMPGFGQGYHTKDLRTARLFELAREAGVDGAHMKAARAVEKSFADARKPLPINVDGAIGAILADLGMNPAAFNGIFMIARTPGLVAHVIEEQTREKPMRRIDPVKHGYDGPPPRGISGGNPKSQDPNPRERGDQR
jgi:succinyl-CoA synthetase alpha subunit